MFVCKNATLGSVDFPEIQHSRTTVGFLELLKPSANPADSHNRVPLSEQELQLSYATSDSADHVLILQR